MLTRKLPIRLILPHIFAMPAHPHRIATALCAWLLAVIAVGAWFAHFLYNGGKALADVSRHKPINAPLDWLAGVCSALQFGDFHHSSIVTVTVLAALPFLPWLLRKPHGPLSQELTALRENLPGGKQAALAAALCVAFCLVLTALIYGGKGIELPRAWIRWILCASGAGLLLELMFRGVVMRVFSNTRNAKRAVIASAVLYALYMGALFPHGIDAWEPILSSTRFPLARSLVSGLSDPDHILGQTVPLLLVGFSLAWARTRTPSLWLVIGIQSGILLAWRMVPHPGIALLAAVSVVFVFCGRPSFRSPREP